ncbi:MAG: hypothetical protein QN178_06740 [Armatimonadota bacterium]|nr:hypothetical protein [Armatimonadota bacterium]
MSLAQKIQEHTRFWSGSAPCLILIPTAQMDLYDTEDYEWRFHDPALMWEAEMRRARPVVGWPTDGIPTVRPNLGVVFVPSVAGLGYTIRPGQMPWPGTPLGRDEIRASRQRPLADAELMRHASAFYALHRAHGGDEVAAYFPDTQGVFDVAHLLYGKDIFTDLIDDPGWVHELLEISLALYTRVSSHLKILAGEDTHTR